MRRFIFEASLLLCLVLCTLSARAADDKGLANNVSIPTTAVSAGATAQLAIELANVTAFTAFQFDIVLPEGITVAQDAVGYLVALSDRGTSQHSPSGNMLSTGEFRVTCFSSKNINFTGNSGAICNITIQADGGMLSGDYPVTVKNVKFSEYVNDAAKGHLLEDATGTITVEAALAIDDNQLYAKDVSIEQGEDAVLNVYYNSTSDVYEYKTTVTLPAGVTVKGVEFLPVVADVANYTNNWTIDGNALTLAGEYGGGRRDVPAEGGNKMFATVLLNTSTLAAGVYSITFREQFISNDDNDYEPASYTAKLTVKGDAPTATATMVIGAGNRYGTFCAPFDVEVPACVTAYTGTVNGNVVELTSVGASIAAGTPVIIESDEAVDKTFTGTATVTGETCTHGNLVGTYNSQTIPQGSYALQKHGDVVAFYLVTSDGVTTRANGCYLTAGTSNKVRMFTFGDATAISGINALIGGNAAIYDAAGARQSRLQKGVNIVVGTDGEAHKVIVK